MVQNPRAKGFECLKSQAMKVEILRMEMAEHEVLLSYLSTKMRAVEAIIMWREMFVRGWQCCTGQMGERWGLALRTVVYIQHGI